LQITDVGMEGKKINSMENLLGLKSSGGMFLDAPMDKISALAFCSLGIGEILNAMKCEVKF